jgi:hypothetical protein
LEPFGELSDNQNRNGGTIGGTIVAPFGDWNRNGGAELGGNICRTIVDWNRNGCANTLADPTFKSTVVESHGLSFATIVDPLSETLLEQKWWSGESVEPLADNVSEPLSQLIGRHCCSRNDGAENPRNHLFGQK